MQDDAVVCVVEREEIREGAADIDTDHPGHCTPRCADLAGRRGKINRRRVVSRPRLRDNAGGGNGMAWVGQSIERVEDAALLTGRGRYIDDIPVSPGTLHAAVLRSPHPHALIRSIDVSAARAAKGVAAVITAEDVTRLGSPLLAGVRANIECWPIAVGKVRYVGEAVAVVVAADRYLAEDALELIEVEYEPLPITLRPADALKPDSAVLHEGLRRQHRERPLVPLRRSGNRVRARHASRVGQGRLPAQFLHADRDLRAGRGLRPGEDAYDVLATFQGLSAFTLFWPRPESAGQPAAAAHAAGRGRQLRREQGIFPYIALMGIAARVAGRRVKWIEDRLEHLPASVSATNRLIMLEAAVEADGRVTALPWDQVEDVGAHIRAPEHATLYRCTAISPARTTSATSQCATAWC